MSEFKNKSITTKGMELLTRALAGEKLEFTKIELGNGNFTGDIGEASELIQLKQSLPIMKISRKGSQVILSATLKMEDIMMDFDWSEIGVYAKGNDGVEILYMYGYTENTSYISKDSLNEKLIHVTVMVSNVAEVTAKIDESLVYLTSEALNEHEVDQEAHGDIRKDIKTLESQLNNIDISWKSIEGKPSSFPPSSHTHSEYLTIAQKSELGGDIIGKTIKHETLAIAYEKNTYAVLKSYSNSKGGMARVHAMNYNTNRTIPTLKLVVDGTTIFDGITLYEMFGTNPNGTGAHYFDIPFKSSFTLYYRDSYGASSTKVSITYYLNI